VLDQTISALSLIITRSHPCQQDLGDDDEEHDVGETAEYDWLVIDTALDVIIGLAMALGPAFGEIWKVFEKPVMKFASSNESIERSTAVGVIADCVGYMGSSVTPYTSSLLRLLLHRLSDEDPETKSNTAYGVGQLILNSEDSKSYLPSYPTILAKLVPLLQSPDGHRLFDNAAGCVCRMITAHPDRVAIEEYLSGIVERLPLTEDYEEHKPIFTCLYKLCTSAETPRAPLADRDLLTFGRRAQRTDGAADDAAAHFGVRESARPTRGAAGRRNPTAHPAGGANSVQGPPGPIPCASRCVETLRRGVVEERILGSGGAFLEGGQTDGRWLGRSS